MAPASRIWSREPAASITRDGARAVLGDEARRTLDGEPRGAGSSSAGRGHRLCRATGPLKRARTRLTVTSPRSDEAASPSSARSAAAGAALSKKAEDLVALDLRDLDGVADYFLICSAQQRSAGQGHRRGGGGQAAASTARARGTSRVSESRRWVLLDYVELVVHVFHRPTTREYYLLERLWGDARKVDLGLDRTD